MTQTLPLSERALHNVGIIGDEAGEEITAGIRTGRQSDGAGSKTSQQHRNRESLGLETIFGVVESQNNVPKCHPHDFWALPEEVTPALPITSRKSPQAPLCRAVIPKFGMRTIPASQAFSQPGRTPPADPANPQLQPRRSWNICKA